MKIRNFATAFAEIGYKSKQKCFQNYLIETENKR